MFAMPGQSYQGQLPPLTAAERTIRNHSRDIVQHLAGTIGERNLWHYQQLEETAQYIEHAFQQLGYRTQRHNYTLAGNTVSNIEAEWAGTSKADEIIVLGAHYDTVLGTPGADDNGSGVAALLELARLLKSQHLKRSIRFVAFVNEEPPFTFTRKMGSRVYTKRIKERGDNVVAMFSLESLGYYSDAKNSQHYPFPFGFFYPNQANFIGFVSNISSRRLLYKTIAAFRQHAQFPSEGVAAPTLVPGIGWSDQWSFWRAGFAAVMITDTALFRNPNYHRATDTIDTIDFDRMARVINGLKAVFIQLANE